jgi:hypothetical protein
MTSEKDKVTIGNPEIYDRERQNNKQLVLNNMGFESNKLEKPFENRHHYTFVNSVHK